MLFLCIYVIVILFAGVWQGHNSLERAVQRSYDGWDSGSSWIIDWYLHIAKNMIKIYCVRQRFLKTYYKQETRVWYPACIYKIWQQVQVKFDCINKWYNSSPREGWGHAVLSLILIHITYSIRIRNHHVPTLPSKIRAF